jgi:nucleoside-diphosphate-sugar epimerase
MACFDVPTEVRNAIFNVTGDSAVPKAEVVDWLAERIGVGRPTFVADSRGSTPGAQGRRGRSGPVPDRVINNHRIKDALGWAPKFPRYREGYERIFALENGRRIH